MKRIICFLAVLSMIISLFAGCGSEKAFVPVTEEELGQYKLNIHIEGKDISSFKIVYASDWFTKNVTDSEEHKYFFRQCAERVQREIEILTGIALPIECDNENGEYNIADDEILIGPTLRGQTLSVYENIDFFTCKNYVERGKLCMGGGYNTTDCTNEIESYSWAATYHAWDYIAAELYNYAKKNNSVEGNVATYNFTNDFLQEEKPDIKMIAFVGDSITAGAGSSSFVYYSFPAYLQRILWKDYIIINYGNCGKTMRSDSTLDNGFINTYTYANMMRYAKDVDRTFIMLGTNDSAQFTFETEEDDRKFIDSGLKLVKSFKDANKNMDFVIMNCPAYYGTGANSDPHMLELQDELFKTMQKKKYDVEFFDMHTFTEENLGVQCFPDLIHPNNQGNEIMAKRMAEYILEGN